MLVNELMDKAPLRVETTTCLREAIPLMSQNKHSCLIVVKENVPVGIITERDVTQLFTRVIIDLSYSERNVEEIMTANPVCVNDTALFKDALMLSRSRKLRHLPVINDNDQLVGVVNQSNLVDAYVRLINLNSELKNNIEELKLLSLEDPLMGIGNRRAMEVDLAHTEQVSEKKQQPYSIALLDIDHFKHYNDHYGHQAGDEVLQKVANALKHSLRDGDRIFRYGGEELLAILREANKDSALKCAERMRTTIEQLGIEHCKSEEGKVTVSIGVATSSEKAWRGIIERADQALYYAKGKGRNRVCAS